MDGELHQVPGPCSRPLAPASSSTVTPRGVGIGTAMAGTEARRARASGCHSAATIVAPECPAETKPGGAA